MGLSTFQTYSRREYAFALRANQCPWSNHGLHRDQLLRLTQALHQRTDASSSQCFAADARTHADTFLPAYGGEHNTTNSKEENCCVRVAALRLSVVSRSSEWIAGVHGSGGTRYDRDGICNYKGKTTASVTL
eukprot:1997213-Rhodomonas_salina.2